MKTELKELPPMKMNGHYIRLREHFPNAAESEQIEVTLDELASILDCTHRNMVLILKRMTELNWLRWSPKRGRGNKSSLTFFVRSEDMSLEIARELVTKKNLQGALELMNRPSTPSISRVMFNDWLYGYLGYRAEVKDQKKVDILRFPSSQPFYTLDPAFIQYTSESQLVSQLFDSLVRYNSLTQTVEPHLAHAWETDESFTVWTFYLRKGVLFHHGREMQADDVAFTLNRLRNSETKSLHRWVLTQINEIEVLDATTIQIRLYERNELFLSYLSTNRAAIVPLDYYTGSPERFAKAPVGTGPFKLMRNENGICVLEAFPSYFQGRAHLDQVEIWNIPNLNNENKQTNMAQNNMDNFQIVHNFRLPDQASASWNQVRQLGTICKFVTLNLLKDGPVRQLGLRRKLARLIESKRGHWVEAFPNDWILPSEGFIRASGRASERGPEEAAEIRPEWTPALELCTIPQYKADANLFRDLCDQSGIQVNVTLLPLEEFQGERRLEADLILFAVLLDNETELRLVDLYKSMIHHMDPTTSDLIEQKLHQIIKEPSKNTRTTLFMELERDLRDSASIIFLYQKHLRTFYHPSVKGISIDSLGWVEFKNIWFHSQSYL